MTANELRIGNWVLWGELMVKLGALNIMEFDIDVMKYEPIPLTPEILEKCEIEFDLFMLGIHSVLGCKIKHLHQLQNLYFALTGNELKIEL